MQAVLVPWQPNSNTAATTTGGVDCKFNCLFQWESGIVPESCAKSLSLRTLPAVSFTPVTEPLLPPATTGSCSLCYVIKGTGYYSSSPMRVERVPIVAGTVIVLSKESEHDTITHTEDIVVMLLHSPITSAAPKVIHPKMRGTILSSPTNQLKFGQLNLAYYEPAIFAQDIVAHHSSKYTNMLVLVELGTVTLTTAPSSSSSYSLSTGQALLLSMPALAVLRANSPNSLSSNLPSQVIVVQF